MAVIPKDIGKGNANLWDLADILNDIADDLAAIQTGLAGQATPVNVTIKTTKQSY